MLRLLRLSLVVFGRDCCLTLRTVANGVHRREPVKVDICINCTVFVQVTVNCTDRTVCSSSGFVQRSDKQVSKLNSLVRLVLKGEYKGVVARCKYVTVSPKQLSDTPATRTMKEFIQYHTISNMLQVCSTLTSCS